MREVMRFSDDNGETYYLEYFFVLNLPRPPSPSCNHGFWWGFNHIKNWDHINYNWSWRYNNYFSKTSNTIIGDVIVALNVFIVFVSVNDSIFSILGVVASFASWSKHKGSSSWCFFIICYFWSDLGFVWLWRTWVLASNFEV